MRVPDWTANRLRERHALPVSAPLIVAVVAFAATRVAWMSDDALINIRAALNAAHGNGAVYNVGERVQTSTSPLWFWVQYVVGRLSGEFIVGSLLVGVVLAAGAALVLSLSARTTAQGLLVPVAFVLSPALVEYSTGGLENAQGMAALAVWFPLLPRSSRSRSLGWGGALGAASALVVLTRLDYVLLVLPALLSWAVVCLRARAFRAVAAATAAAVVPVVVWAASQELYYGEVLPNTFAAKTNVDIPRMELVFSGLRYVAVSTEYDPIIALVLIVSTVLAMTLGGAIHRAACIGIWLYVGYVLWIGGDFMAGRFFTGPMVLGLALMTTVPLPSVPLATVGDRFRWDAGIVLLAGFTAAGLALAAPFPGAYDAGPRWDYNARGGVSDEAGFYRVRGQSLYALLFGTGAEATFTEPDGDGFLPPLWQLRRLEDQWHRVDERPPGQRRDVVVFCGGMGSAGLAVGPAVHVVDPCALADPFLAELPYEPPASYDWRIGHFERPLPAGYLEAVTYGEPDRLDDPRLRELLVRTWDRVRRRATDGP